jgi:hypothetical protein
MRESYSWVRAAIREAWGKKRSILFLAGGFSMPGQWAVIALIVAMALLTGLFMAYKMMASFRFWFFDIWADLPVVGTVARWSRLSTPSTALANARLDKLFHAYWLHIPTPIDEQRFDQVKRYLFLSRDSQSKPTPMGAWLLLLLLICAESYAFSFLLGVSLSTDMSENRASLMAVGIAFILGLTLLWLAHYSGHALRRANELRRARRHAIAYDTPLPDGEKQRNMLTRPVSLEDPQDQDEPIHCNFESQRFLNRAATGEGDRGNYVLPGLFIAAVLLLAFEQFQLRNVMAAITESAGMSGLASAEASSWANGLFVVIFLMTQGLALLFGYRFGFLGQESEAANKIIGGRNDYNEYRQEREPMVRRADESLASLYTKMRARYTNIDPEDMSFAQRVEREEPRVVKAAISPKPSPTTPATNQDENATDNVTVLSRDSGAPAA